MAQEKHCNLGRQGETFGHPNLIVRKALESIEKFKTAYARPHAEGEGTSSNQKWIVLAVSKMKINWDAAVDKD
jgi:hypothetical protein